MSRLIREREIAVDDEHTIVLGHMVPDGWMGIKLEWLNEDQSRSRGAIVPVGYMAEMTVAAITAGEHGIEGMSDKDIARILEAIGSHLRRR
jgi:hypothetical protein